MKWIFIESNFIGTRICLYIVIKVTKIVPSYNYHCTHFHFILISIGSLPMNTHFSPTIVISAYKMIILVDNIAVKWAPKQRNKNKIYLLLVRPFFLPYKPSEFPSSNFGSMKLCENRKTFSSAFTFIRIVFMFLIWWLMILLRFSLVWIAFLLLRNVFPSKSLFFDSLLFCALLFKKKKTEKEKANWWCGEQRKISDFGIMYPLNLSVSN